MTLVLGARCSDGVVIVTDMKITSWATGRPVFLRYESKISGVFTNIIFGYAGDVDTYELFLNYAVGDSVRKRDDPNDVYTNDNFIQKLCDNMIKLRTTLVRNGKILLLRLMIGRQFPGNGKSDLHTVTSNVIYDEKLDQLHRIDNYAVIGDVEICATDLVRGKWKSGMTIKEFVELSYSVIRYIEQNSISEAVGLGCNKPPVKYLKDAGIIDTELTDEEWKQFKESYQAYAEHFDRVRPATCQQGGS